MESGGTILVVEGTTFVFLKIQSMASTKIDINTRHTYTALNMKSVSTTETPLRGISTIMKRPVLSALLSHVVQC